MSARGRLSIWWVDLPARRKGWLRHLLLQSGSGWLRWKPKYITRYDTSVMLGGSPPEPYFIAPPLHRIWIMVWYLDRSAWHWAADPDRGDW